jgi:hypothetical protein
VPSTVVIEKSAIAPGVEAGSEVRYPGFVAILNASYKFYLESLPALIDRIEESESTSCFDRNVWTKRLESWTMKAIEDSELLAGAARV